MDNKELVNDIIDLLNTNSPIGRYAYDYNVCELIEELLDLIANLEEQIEDAKMALS